MMMNVNFIMNVIAISNIFDSTLLKLRMITTFHFLCAKGAHLTYYTLENWVREEIEKKRRKEAREDCVEKS